MRMSVCENKEYERKKKKERKRSREREREVLSATLRA